MTCIINNHSITCYRGRRVFSLENKVTKEQFSTKLDLIDFNDLKDETIIDVFDKSNKLRKFQKKFLNWI